MNLNWLKHATGWYSFFDVDLSSSHFDNLVGVYIIWHGGTNPAVVRVGQGIIRDRLTAHRNDSAISAYRPYGMFVTWAAVPAHSLDGVERHLAETWTPKVGDRFPAVAPIRVLSPFS